MGTVELVSLIIDGVIGGIDAFRKVMNDLQQQGELSEQEAQDFTARMEAHFKSPAWRTDDELAAEREAAGEHTEPPREQDTTTGTGGNG